MKSVFPLRLALLSPEDRPLLGPTLLRRGGHELSYQASSSEESRGTELTLYHLLIYQTIPTCLEKAKEGWEKGKTRIV